MTRWQALDAVSLIGAIGRAFAHSATAALCGAGANEGQRPMAVSAVSVPLRLRSPLIAIRTRIE